MKSFFLVTFFVFLVSAGVSYAEEGSGVRDPGGEHSMMMERGCMCGHGGMDGNEMMGSGGMMNTEMMMHHMMSLELKNIEMYLMNKEELSLSSDQIEKLKGIKIDFEKAAVAKEADIKIAMIDIKAAAMKDKPDFSTVRQKVQAIGKLYTDLFTAKVDNSEKGYNVLTDQQKQKALTIRDQMMKKMMKGEMKDKMKGER
jgi:hypothetical protein